MVRRSFPLVALSFLLLSAACNSGEPDHPNPEISSATITVDQLPPEFDAARTYHYGVGHVSDPRGMLVAMWSLGLESSRAWQPLDDTCFDPVGPQFTVEFVADDPRIAEHGFLRGDGRLRCATKLSEYTISRAGN